MPSISWLRRIIVFSIAFKCLGLAGCGGPANVGQVTGSVTLNGAPLSGALVRFQPLATGSPSAAITDGDGKYSLKYTRSVLGAEVGEHQVSITTFAAGDPDADTPQASVPEKVPARYNSATELTATVKPGANQIDFPLEASGEVAQPLGNSGE